MTGEFYVYAHRRLDNGAVFYIGKGKGRRAHQTHSRNRWWKFIVQKYGFEVEFLEVGLCEEDAFARERHHIAEFGFDNLCNLSLGGDGPSGSRHSKEANAKKSEVVRGAWEGNEARKLEMSNRFSSAWADGDFRKKVIAAQKEAHAKPEVRAAKVEKMRELRATPVRCLDTGVEYRTIADAVDWLRSFGKEKAVACSISYAASGKRASAYGCRWEYV